MVTSANNKKFPFHEEDIEQFIVSGYSIDSFGTFIPQTIVYINDDENYTVIDSSNTEFTELIETYKVKNLAHYDRYWIEKHGEINGTKNWLVTYYEKIPQYKLEEFQWRAHSPLEKIYDTIK